MEGFIFENGAERKADLEDLFPLIFDERINRAKFQYFLRKVRFSGIHLADAIAFLPNEIKEMVYRNVPVRGADLYKEDVNWNESHYEKDNPVLHKARAELIDFLGKFEEDRFRWHNNLIERVIWRNPESEEEKAKKPSPLETLNKHIEEALNSGKLDILFSYADRLTHDDIRNALQNHQNDLHKIRELSINGKYLPAAALLFETGKIEDLYISDITDGEWPSFMENCHALTELTIYTLLTGEFPPWIRNASSLCRLDIMYSNIASLPDWIGDLQSLTKLFLLDSIRLKTLPDSIGNLKNLDRLNINNSQIKSLPESIGNLKKLRELLFIDSPLEKIPDCIGDLQSLAELFLSGNIKLDTLPDSIGNLKNLRKLSLNKSSIKKLPDWIGDLQSLTRLSLNNNKNLESLPDSIGNLKNLVSLDISNSPIEELPSTIVNCTSLNSVDILRTKITSVPDFIKSANYFNDNTEIEIIPMGHSLSYRCFCNSYYRLAETILAFNKKARREGLLALEEELEHHTEGFFKRGVWMVTEGMDAEYIRDVLQIRLEREHDFYRKKLMKAAMEGILSIQSGDSMMTLALLLASLVNIKDNPLDAAITKDLSGDSKAIDNIDFSAAIQSEDVSEEILFIERAIDLSAIAYKEGLLALREHLDHEGIARRDVFEFGIALVTEGWNIVYIEKFLDNLIAHETDPVQKNLAQAKKEAVKAISEGDQPRQLLVKLCAFLDDDDAAELMKMIN
jgi:Leucine-rich repeat (LRR) protein